ncbi:MAG: PKD domain-containing protein [Caulobacteraceae bacterium]|nr:PKD domain-containing protein [Caulobacteraceae bacterium]
MRAAGWASALVAALLTWAPAAAQGLSVRASAPDARFQLLRAGERIPVLAGGFAVEVDGRWIGADAYPSRRVVRAVRDEAGAICQETSLVASGRPDAPDLTATLSVCGAGEVARLNLTARNGGAAPFRIGGFRPIVGALDAAGAGVRVLSDSYSEDTPVLKVRDLLDGAGPHLGYGHQLVFDRAAGRGVLVGALSADRWLTYLRLAPTAGGPARLEVEQAGVTRAALTKSLDRSRPQDVMTYEAPLAAGQALSGEPLLIGAGGDEHWLMEAYGDAVGRLDGARVSGPAPWGWWSWTAYYHGINEGVATANALWLAQHLKDQGFDTLHLDEGVTYARGEYETADAGKFPHGMEAMGRTASRLGLRLGMWTAPFYVSERSRVFAEHPDWLVRNGEGQPILVGRQEGRERLFALDTTHPGAQAYLRQTYATLAHVWGVGYLKLDFMDATAVEGVRYDRGLSALQAQRLGLRIIREAVGEDVVIDKDGSPMLSPVGLVDAGRISNDTEHSWQGTKDAASGVAARWFMNRRWFVADPDVFCLSNHISREPRWDESVTSLDEARAAITLSALAGGLFEIGDDLPALGAEPERLALLTQPDLLAMARLGRAATPADLMRFDPADGQPSVFVLRESARQAVVAVFNWTDGVRAHRLPLRGLGLEPGPWTGREVWTGAVAAVADGALTVADQPAHSVRLFVLTRSDRAARAPQAAIVAPAQAAPGESVALTARLSGDSAPAVAYLWRFDDGVEIRGARAVRAFTLPGERTASLTVTGIDGLRSSSTARIEVAGDLVTTFQPDRLRRPAGGGASGAAQAGGSTP